MNPVEIPKVTLTVAQTPSEMAVAREVLLEYEASLKVDLCFQELDVELATLPGDYAAPRGKLPLAMV